MTAMIIVQRNVIATNGALSATASVTCSCVDIPSSVRLTILKTGVPVVHCQQGKETGVELVAGLDGNLFGGFLFLSGLFFGFRFFLGLDFLQAEDLLTFLLFEFLLDVLLVLAEVR